MKITTFKDIEFQKTKIPNGIQAMLSFGDDYKLSIVKNDMSYGHAKDLYEIAAFKYGVQVIMPGITEDHDTIKGFLSEDNVIGIVKKMHLVTGADPEAI